MMKFEGFPHVIYSQQFSADALEELFRMANEMESFRYSCGWSNKTMISLFYEPSTRTRISFEMAMVRLGGHVISTESAKEFSSAVKGETVEDTIKVLCRYNPDVIVLRHYEEGSAARAVKVSSVPIINAGDGAGQHPTQALLDLYTIKKRFGCINGISVAMVGDLENGRTARSLAYLLGKFKGVNIYFVSPLLSGMKNDIKDYLKLRGVSFCQTEDLKSVMPLVDVVYQTRIQKERGSDFDGSKFIIDRAMAEKARACAVIMHPLPRSNEISIEVDDDPRAAYFDQAENGLYIRMALLKMILAY